MYLLKDCFQWTYWWSFDTGCSVTIFLTSQMSVCDNGYERKLCFVDFMI